MSTDFSSFCPLKNALPSARIPNLSVSFFGVPNMSVSFSFIPPINVLFFHICFLNMSASSTKDPENVHFFPPGILKMSVSFKITILFLSVSYSLHPIKVLFFLSRHPISVIIFKIRLLYLSISSYIKSHICTLLLNPRIRSTSQKCPLLYPFYPINVLFFSDSYPIFVRFFYVSRKNHVCTACFHPINVHFLISDCLILSVFSGRYPINVCFFVLFLLYLSTSLTFLRLFL